MEEKHSHTLRERRTSNFTSLFFRKREDEVDPSVLTSIISDYEIIRDCGGAEDISFLFLAKHILSGQSVSLKLTDMTLSEDAQFIQECVKTIHHNSLLRHPNIAPHFVSFIHEEELWSVSIPQEGTLRTLMKESFPDGLGEIAVASILKEVLKALVYIHENHCIHNDIRADNILIDSDGDIRLGGFRQIMDLQTCGKVKKATFNLVGDNIEWAAPEVMAQNSNFNWSADIYSLGITALELAFNRTPFDNWPPLKVLLSKLHYPCPPAIKSEKTMSRSFYRFVQACAHKDPKRRPTAEELLDHPYIKQARNHIYLENLLIKRRDPGISEEPTTILKSPRPLSPVKMMERENSGAQ